MATQPYPDLNTGDVKHIDRAVKVICARMAASITVINLHREIAQERSYKNREIPCRNRRRKKRI
jgi:hypothetical protein